MIENDHFSIYTKLTRNYVQVYRIEIRRRYKLQLSNNFTASGICRKTQIMTIENKKLTLHISFLM